MGIERKWLDPEDRKRGEFLEEKLAVLEAKVERLIRFCGQAASFLNHTLACDGGKVEGLCPKCDCARAAREAEKGE